MIINTDKEVWSEELCKLDEMWWLLNFYVSTQRNIKSKTEFEF